MPASDPQRTARRTAASTAAATWLILAACIALSQFGAACAAEEAAAPPPASTNETVEESAGVAGNLGPGVVQGRIVDAVSGLPVSDALVRLHALGRQVRSAPDGRFRFEGVDPGRLAVRVLPPAAHLPRALEATAGDGGLNLGLVRLAPAGNPTLIVPEYGGVAPACGRTQLAFATESVTSPVRVRVACVAEPDLMPAPPPAERDVLRVIHASPADVQLAQPAILTVGLPAQPQLAPGTYVDLLRLDLDTLMWQPAGALEVEAGGDTARGLLAGLGTLLITAPPVDVNRVAAAPPTVAASHVALRPGGPATDVVAPDTGIVYLNFEYAGMANTRLRVVTVDEAGETVFAADRPYTGAGHDEVPMLPRDEPWAIGVYTSHVEIVGGLPPGAPAAAPERRDAIAWAVEEEVEEAGTPGAGCAPPAGWYPYNIRSGDTLFALALSYGMSAAELARANCLAGDAIYSGTVLYVPAPPAPPPYTPLPTYYPPARGYYPLPTPPPWFPPWSVNPGPARPPVTWPPQQPGGPPTSPGGETPPPEPTLAIRPTTPPLP